MGNMAELSGHQVQSYLRRYKVQGTGYKRKITINRRPKLVPSSLYFRMQFEWLKTGIGPLKELIAFLNKEGKTNDVLKRQVIRELRNNLNIFHNGFMNNVSQDTMIDMLSNDMIKEAIKENFKFRKLKPGRIEPYHVFDDRNKKYTGWETDKLIDKIDEKIEELKNIKKMNNGSVDKVKNNISLMLSNLYYRMKLLADFIRSDIK
jgi:hypothetical protein